jgi:putative serine protease PepD
VTAHGKRGGAHHLNGNGDGGHKNHNHHGEGTQHARLTLSDGALLNGAGLVIGINSAIASMATGNSEAGNIGLGFAIPINTAKRIAEELIATGTSKTPIIGVNLDTSYEGPGAKVLEIIPNGPSEDAGLQKGDIITSLGGRQVEDATELVVAIRTYAPGDQVEVQIDRGGGDVTATITLGSAE